MKKRNKPMDIFRLDSIFVAIAVIVFGLIFVVFPESSTLVICYAVGVALCIWGALRILSYFTTKREEAFTSYGLVQGIALLVPGIYILATPEFLAGVLTAVFGVILIIDGALKLQHAVDLKRIQAGQWKLLLLLATLTVVLGMIVLFNPFAAAATLVMFVGVALLIDGILDLVTVVYISLCLKNLEKAISDAKAVPTDGEEVSGEETDAPG